MPRTQSIVQRNKLRKMEKCNNVPEVPSPWEKLVTYKTNGEVFEEYYMNSKTNAIVYTVKEVLDQVNNIPEITKIVEKHPECWTHSTHYGQCGQSCPCCRKKAGDILGACTICK